MSASRTAPAGRRAHAALLRQLVGGPLHGADRRAAALVYRASPSATSPERSSSRARTAASTSRAIGSLPERRLHGVRCVSEQLDSPSTQVRQSTRATSLISRSSRCSTAPRSALDDGKAPAQIRAQAVQVTVGERRAHRRVGGVGVEVREVVDRRATEEPERRPGLARFDVHPRHEAAKVGRASSARAAPGRARPRTREPRPSAPTTRPARISASPEAVRYRTVPSAEADSTAAPVISSTPGVASSASPRTDARSARRTTRRWSRPSPKSGIDWCTSGEPSGRRKLSASSPRRSPFDQLVQTQPLEHRKPVRLQEQGGPDGAGASTRSRTVTRRPSPASSRAAAAPPPHRRPRRCGPEWCVEWS